MSRPLSGKLAAIVVGLVAYPELDAARPRVHAFHFDRTVVDMHLCGYPIEVHDEGGVRLALHSDRTGNVAWINVTTANYRITLTNPATGQSLSTPSPEHVLVTGYEAAHSGLVTRFVLPGVGLLALDAGRVTFEPDGDVAVSGPHMLLEGDVAALCAALAGKT